MKGGHLAVAVLLVACSSDAEPKRSTSNVCPKAWTEAEACNALLASPGDVCHACEFGRDYCVVEGPEGEQLCRDRFGVWVENPSGVYFGGGDREATYDCYEPDSCAALCESVTRYPAECFARTDCPRGTPWARQEWEEVGACELQVRRP